MGAGNCSPRPSARLMIWIMPNKRKSNTQPQKPTATPADLVYGRPRERDPNADDGTEDRDVPDPDLLLAAGVRASLADFMDGAYALTLIPLAACTPAERAIYLSELLSLRQALIEEHGATKASDLMLLDGAALGFFEARRLAAKAAMLLTSEQIDQVRAGEILDKAANRAHARFSSALDLLRRGRQPHVRFEVEAVEQLHVGDKVVSLAADGKRGR